MKVKFGMIVVAGRGKIGGHVASRNRAGAYFRTKVSPVNPQTTYQSNVRNRLGNLSSEWRGLTPEQRESWNAAVENFAKTDVFGDIKNPSGFNLFQRLRNNLATAQTSGILVAPAPEQVAAVGIGAATVDIGTGDAIELATSGAVPSGSKMLVYATPGVSPGINFVKSEYRLLQVVAASAASPHDLQTAYEARFGTPAAGQKVFFKIKFINTTTGQASSEQSTSTIVVDT